MEVWIKFFLYVMIVIFLIYECIITVDIFSSWYKIYLSFLICGIRVIVVGKVIWNF